MNERLYARHFQNIIHGVIQLCHIPLNGETTATRGRVGYEDCQRVRRHVAQGTHAYRFGPMPHAMTSPGTLGAPTPKPIAGWNRVQDR